VIPRSAPRVYASLGRELASLVDRSDVFKGSWRPDAIVAIARRCGGPQPEPHIEADEHAWDGARH